jgi:predicted  nucleic acid-binding Zn-ribbon protein
MSEDRTQNLPNDDLRQILAQLTSINTRLDSVDSHLDGVDSRLERLEARDHDTKPIWENALKEIADTRAEMREGFTKVGGGLTKVGDEFTKVGDEFTKVGDEFTKVHADMDNLRAEMDAGLRKVARQIDALNNNLLGVQVELRGLDAVVSRLETQAAQ